MYCVLSELGQLEVEEVEKEMETARIEESMKEADTENIAQAEEEESQMLPPETEGQSPSRSQLTTLSYLSLE